MAWAPAGAGSRRQWLVFTVVVCLAAVALGLGWADVLTRHTGEGARASLCRSYSSFAAAMKSADVSRQAARRYRTTRLAVHSLAFPATPQPDAPPVPAAAERLRAQMLIPYADVRGTFEAARPAAVPCDMDWR